MIHTLALSRLMVNIGLEPKHGKSAVRMNSGSESDTSSSDESVYLSASDGSQNGLHSGSPRNGNVPLASANERHETNKDPPSSENATNLESTVHRDENLTENGDSNDFDPTEVDSLSDSDSASFTTAPSMPMPLQIFTSDNSGPALAVALPEEDSNCYASSNNRIMHSSRGKENSVQAACQTALRRNQIRHADGIPRPSGALAPIPPWRGTSSAQATSQGLFDSTTSGKSIDAQAIRRIQC